MNAFRWIMVGGTIAASLSVTLASSMPLDLAKIATVQFTPPPPPPEDAPAGRARGGASRGDCTQVQPQLTAIAPIATTAKQKTSVWGLTTAPHPTVWIYLPYTRTTTPIEFVLQDAIGTPIYSTPIALPSQAGIVGIKIPDSVTLTVGQRYRWFVNVFCDPEKQLPPVSIDGSIQRIALSPVFTKQLNSSTQQQVETYAANGIWYDLLTTLVILKQSNPQDPAIAQAWQNLLQSIGYKDIATKPLATR